MLNLNNTRLHRDASATQWIGCLLCACLVGNVLTETATALHTISTPEEDVVVLNTTHPEEVSPFTSTLLYANQTVEGGDVTLSAGQTLAVTYYGETQTVTTKGETLSKLLDRLDMSPTPLELVVVDYSQDPYTVVVDANYTYYEQVSEVSTYQTQRVANPNLVQGMEQVVQAGANGTVINTYEVVYTDGTLLSRQLVEQSKSTAVDEIIEYGTAVPDVGRNDPLVDVVTNADGSGYLSFESGATLPFSGTKDMTATAYTGGVGKVGWITATGTRVHVGVIAVDKRVIPLGTKMFVVTNDGIVYGTGVAEDTGVIGNIVDLYHNSYDECIQFGRRGCTVYFID